MSVVTCPNCKHVFAPSTVMADGAIDAYWAVERGGLSNKAFSASRNVSPTTTTLYRRLGICLVDIGVSPVSDADMWSRLSGGVGQPLAINDALVRAAIEDRVGVARLRELVLRP